MKHGNSINPHIAEKSPVKNIKAGMPEGKTTAKSMPTCKSTTRKRAIGKGKGNRHR